MKKIAISIPVHESPECVKDLLLNIQKFVPNSVVILHVSADGPPNFWNYLNSVAKNLDGFVYLNPTRFHTFAQNEAANVTGLSSVHASNFLYLKSVLSFDLFALNTSNDMFVRGGIQEQVFESFNCGFHTSMTPPELYPFQDVLKDIEPFVAIKYAEKGSQEGSFYPAYVFEEVAKIVNKIGTSVKAEEMYLPCLAFNLFPELYQQNSGCHYIYHNPAHYSITKEDIHKTQYGEYGLRFGVKRVPRNINDPIRKYIGEITK